jgi:hypothetical protein
MAVSHSLYGLFLFSNVPIPGLPILGGSCRPEIEIRFEDPSASLSSIFSEPTHFFYRSPNVTHDGQPVARVGSVGSRHFVFEYGDGTRFAVRRDGREVIAAGPANYPLEDLATYLLGPVMGFVLRLFGTLPLHGCAVAVEGKAVALIGPQGSGKSTTAAAFAKLGYGVIAEDVVALAEANGRFLVQPGYPRVNLWPDSAETLFGAGHALPLVTPNWGKHFLSLDGSQHRFRNEPLELGAIFILEDRIATAAEPRVERVSPASALPMVVANTYVNYLLDADMRRAEFFQLGGLLKATPTYQVWPADDASRVFDLCASISAQACAGTASAAHP